jgi:outer membrane lipoprotein-sorting protein
MVIAVATVIVIESHAPAWTAGKQTCQQVLDKAKKTFESLKGFQADLTEAFQWNLAETTTETSGKMMYRSDNRFRLEFPNQKLIVDGKVLYRYNSEYQQLLIEPYTEDSGVILPKQLLAGLSNRWNLVDGSKTAVEDSTGYRLDLQAKDQESAFRNVTVWINPSDWLVRKALIDDVQGNRTVYRIDQVVLNPVLHDSLFQVHVPKGTETIDLR